MASVLDLISRAPAPSPSGHTQKPMSSDAKRRDLECAPPMHGPSTVTRRSFLASLEPPHARHRTSRARTVAGRARVVAGTAPSGSIRGRTICERIAHPPAGPTTTAKAPQGMILGLATVTITVSVASADFPTTCLEFNDMAEAARGSGVNKGRNQERNGVRELVDAVAGGLYRPCGQRVVNSRARIARVPVPDADGAGAGLAFVCRPGDLPGFLKGLDHPGILAGRRVRDAYASMLAEKPTAAVVDVRGAFARVNVDLVGHGWASCRTRASV